MRSRDNKCFMAAFILALVWTLFPVLPVEAKEEMLKMGTVNLSRIFDEYQRTQDADTELGGEGQVKQEEREKAVAEIRRLKDEAELLSESSREGKQKEIDRKIKELQAFDQKTREALRARRDDMVRDILQEIQAQIDAYSEAKGYDLVLSDRMLLYSNGSVDITNEILAILNEKYGSQNR